MAGGSEDNVLVGRLESARDELASAILLALAEGMTVEDIAERLRLTPDDVDRVVGDA